MQTAPYRAKSKDKGEWIYGSLAKFSVAPPQRKDGKYEPLQFASHIQYTCENGYTPAVQVVEKTICRNTTICDKNGTCIFEHDKVLYNDGFHCFVAKVVFECGAFGIAIDVYPFPFKWDSWCENDNFVSFWEMLWNCEDVDNIRDGMVTDIEVIGNKFDDLVETVETCPYCDDENIYYNFDIKKQGYITKCNRCGRKIFLCDECQHSEDNEEMRCDWTENEKYNTCFRGCICKVRKVEDVLEKKIANQRKENIRMYALIKDYTHGKEVDDWRVGLKKMQELMKEKREKDEH